MRKAIGILIMMSFLAIAAVAQVTTWTPPEGFSSEKYYKVKVNGVEVPVFDTPVASWAAFDFQDNVLVEVITMYDVRWVDVRPGRLHIKPTYTSDHSFSFIMDRPAYVSLELNGRIRQQPLFLFGGSPETDVPNRLDKNVIWFEKGKLYKNVSLELQDNQTVYVEGGAVVQGYLHARGKKNIRVIGRGIFDGTFNKTTPGNDNRFLHFEDCENVEVKDVVLHNGTTWQLAFFHSTGIRISGARIVSESGSDDGIDILRCRDVLVDNVFAHTKDDCVAIKSGGSYPADHPTDNIVVRNCVFWNSIWGNAIEVGFELYSNEVKNIKFENIDVLHVEDGSVMSIHNAGPAHVHDVVFENIRVEDARQKLFDVAIFFSRWSPDGIQDEIFLRENYLHGAWDGVHKVPVGKEAYHLQFRGRVSGITFRNIEVSGALPFSVFHGFDSNHDVSNVKIENLRVNGNRVKSLEAARIRVQNATGIVIK